MLTVHYKCVCIIETITTLIEPGCSLPDLCSGPMSWLEAPTYHSVVFSVQAYDIVTISLSHFEVSPPINRPIYSCIQSSIIANTHIYSLRNHIIPNKANVGAQEAIKRPQAAWFLGPSGHLVGNYLISQWV